MRPGVNTHVCLDQASCCIPNPPGVTGAGVTGAEVTGAGVTGAGVTGAGVNGAGVTGTGVTGAGVIISSHCSLKRMKSLAAAQHVSKSCKKELRYLDLFVVQVLEDNTNSLD
jgi:hypothetical protein